MWHLGITQKCVFLIKIDTFRPFSVKPAGRCFDENDRPPSFQGAPDLGYAPRFSSFFLARAESRFDGDSTLPPQAGNAHQPFGSP